MYMSIVVFLPFLLTCYFQDGVIVTPRALAILHPLPRRIHHLLALDDDASGANVSCVKIMIQKRYLYRKINSVMQSLAYVL